jgi:hypothetical protein
LAPSSVARYRTGQVSLDLPVLALDGGLLNLQVGEDLRLDQELVGNAVRLPEISG